MTRLLFDSHALYWFLRDDPELPPAVSDTIATSGAELLYSAVNVYELEYKASRGRLELPSGPPGTLPGQLRRLGLVELPLSALHADHAALLSLPHRDPFDRMLVAQALVEGIPLISNERLFDTTGVERLWE